MDPITITLSRDKWELVEKVLTETGQWYEPDITIASHLLDAAEEIQERLSDLSLPSPER